MAPLRVLGQHSQHSQRTQSRMSTADQPTSPVRKVAAVLLRRPSRTPRWLFAASIAAVTAGAGLIAVSAAIHLHLWLQGYRDINVVGPLFLAQVVVGWLLTLVILGVQRVITVLVGAGYLISTAVGLLLSASVGLFGFQDSLTVPWAATSLWVEFSGAVVLLVAAVMLAARR